MKNKHDLTSVESVEKELKISSIASMAKEKIPAFVSLIPRMDKEVAKACIAQFPKMQEYSVNIVNYLSDLVKENMKTNYSSTLKGYQTILDTISPLAQREDLDQEERKYLIDQMVYISYQMERVDDKKRNSNENLFGIVASVGGALGMGLLAILGIRSYRK